MTRRTTNKFDKAFDKAFGAIDRRNNPPDETTPMMQAVVLTLGDGREVTFTGPAQIFEEGAVIKEVRVTPPEPLPPGCSWEDKVFNYGEAP